MIELADHENRVGTNPLAHHSVSPGRPGNRLDHHGIALTDPKVGGGLPVYDHALMARNIVGDLVDQRIPTLAPHEYCMLRAVSAHKRVRVGIVTHLLGVVDPDLREVVVAWQRLVFFELLVPPFDADLV